jgi:photosystem II stability/assembly factor-like uncharacterized protein
MESKTFKQIEGRKKKKINGLFVLSFFFVSSLISFSLIGCDGGGGGGGGGFLPASGGPINPALFSGWEMTNGPFSGMVYSFAVDPNDSQKVFAALEEGGLFKSRQGGNDWGRVDGQLIDVSISAVDVHVDGLTIYVGTGSDGIYKSLDGGDTWVQASNGLPVDSQTGDYYEIFEIKIDPTDADTVYALSGNRWYICMTTDAGVSWTRIDGGARPQGGLPWDRIEAFEIHPDNNQWLYVGMYANGVYKGAVNMATDEVNWNPINGDPANGGLPDYVVHIPCIAIDQENNILYAGSRDYGLWKTLDDGITWERIEVGPNTDLEYWDVYVLAMDPINKSTIYAYVETVPPTVQPADDGIYRTFDGGSTWVKVPFHEYLNSYRPVREIAMAPSDGKVVYVTTQGEGIFMTNDVTNVVNVDDWQSIDNGLVDLQVLTMLMHPWDNRIVYVGTEERVYKTTDGGLTWKRNGLEGNHVFALVLDPMDANTIYAATDDGVYKTTNGGDSWSEWPSGFWFYSLAIGRNPLNPDTNIIYGGSPFGRGIYKAEDDGSIPWDEIEWEERNDGLSEEEKYITYLAIDTSDPLILYAGTSSTGKVLKMIETTAGGDYYWDRKTNGLSPGESVIRLSIDPYNPQILYAGTYAGFYVSTDGGDTWVFKDGGLGQRYVRSIAIDPMDSKKVCVGTYSDGAFASIDGGENWVQIDQGLISVLNKKVCSLAMDIEDIDNPVIYAGTGCGVFKAYK